MTPAPALVAASHGTSDPAGRRAVAGLVAAVAARADAEVLEAFVDVQQPDVPTVLDALAPAPAIVVPLLLSAGYHVRIDLARDAREAAGPVSVAGALGPDARLVDILVERLGDLLSPGDALVLAAAGSSDPRAADDCREVGRALCDRLGQPVTVAFISAAQPELRAAIAAERAAGAARVVVATYLLAPGYFADLAAAAGGDAWSPPLLVDGGPVPTGLVDIVLDRFDAARFATAATA